MRSFRFTPHSDADSSHIHLRIALVGTPNVGKSAFFNYLTGDSQKISEWVPSTIPKYEGQGHLGNYIFHILDLPGIYSLSSDSSEKIITRDYLINQKPDYVINVIDANQLERSLFLTLQLLSLGLPMVIAVNQYDLLKKRGYDIQFDLFFEKLGVPILPTIGIHYRNVHQLLEKIIELDQIHQKFEPKVFEYGKEVNFRIKEMAILFHQYYPNHVCSPRFAAIKLLKQDIQMIRTLHLEQAGENIAQLILSTAKNIQIELEKIHGESINAILDGELFAIANRIAQDVVIIKPSSRKQKVSHWLDYITLSPIWGYIVFLILMGGIFLIVFSFGAWIGNWIDSIYDQWTIDIIPVFGGESNFWYHLIWSGIVGGFFMGVGGILPLLIPFYFLIIFLQEVGYLPRAAYLMDSFLHRIGVHGKTIIPILLGFGCTVPAITISALMDTEEQKRRSILLSNMIPCSAIMTIVFGLVGRYLGIGYAFLLYGVNFFVLILIGKALTIQKPTENAELIIELHDFAKPNWTMIFKQTWFQTKEFILLAIPLIMGLGGILQLLIYLNWLNMINLIMSPLIVSWLGLPIGVGVYLIYGILRKELNLVLLSIYVASLGLELNEYLSPIQMIVFVSFTMLYVPCLATTITIKRETSIKFAIGVFFLKLGLAILIVGGFRWLYVAIALVFNQWGENLQIISTFIIFFAFLILVMIGMNLYRQRKHQR